VERPGKQKIATIFFVDPHARCKENELTLAFIAIPLGRRQDAGAVRLHLFREVALRLALSAGVVERRVLDKDVRQLVSLHVGVEPLPDHLGPGDDDGFDGGGVAVLGLPLDDGGLALPDNVVQSKVVIGVQVRDEDYLHPLVIG